MSMAPQLWPTRETVVLSIPCPWCGPRDEVEFHYGGQAHVAYPEDAGAIDDAAWADFVFMRDNPKGTFTERWAHAGGCRRWFNAIRDTLTHEILAVYLPAQPPPSSVPGRSRI